MNNLPIIYRRFIGIYRFVRGLVSRNPGESSANRQMESNNRQFSPVAVTRASLPVVPTANSLA